MSDTPETPKPPETPPAPPAVKEPKAAIVAGGKVMAIVPQNVEEAFRLAEAFVRSSTYPDSYKVMFRPERPDGGHFPEQLDLPATISRVMVGIMKGAEVGMPPVMALSTIYLVNNRATIFGDGIPALLYGSGKIEYIKETFEGKAYEKDFTAICSIKRRDTGEVITRTFSWEDAQKAGLAGKKGPWQEYPKRQLQMRARAWAARDGAADILAGLGITEEVRDIDVQNRRDNAGPLDTSALDDKPLVLPAVEPATPPETVSTATETPEVSDPLPEPSKPQETKTSEKPPTSECSTCGGAGEVPMTNEETGEEVYVACPDCVPDK